MRKGFISLFTTNFWGVVNDNYLKAVASFVAVTWVEPKSEALFISIAAAALVLPYVLLSPLAGRLAQRYDKRDIVLWAKAAELPIMALAMIGFIYQSIHIVLSAILLMGIQSALFSPAKYGLVRDIGGEKGISFGIGGMEGVSFLGMLSGMLVAAFLVDNPSSRLIVYSLFGIIAIMGLLSASTIKKSPSTSSDTKYTANPIKALVEMYRASREYKGLNSIIFVLSIFWWFAASLQIGLLIYCKSVLNISSWHTGIVLSMAAVGITLGCVLSGIIFRKQNRYMNSVVSGILLAIILTTLFFIELPTLYFGIAIFIVALLAGFFKVPLDGAIQHIAKGSFLSLALGYFNQVSFIFILFASLSMALITTYLDITYMFLMLGVIILVATITLIFKIPALLLNLVKNILSIRYKIVVNGIESLDSDKNYLFLPNHTAVIDPIILFCSLYETPIRPFVDEGYVRTPFIGGVIRSFNSISVPDISVSRAGIMQAQMLESYAISALNDGDNILLYPSGMITKCGSEQIGNKQLAHNISQHITPNTQVIAIRMEGLWGSSFSRYGRSSTPNIITTILAALPSLLYFRRRRRVTLTLSDITSEVYEQRTKSRKEFNSYLESIYNKGTI